MIICVIPASSWLSIEIPEKTKRVPLDHFELALYLIIPQGT